MIRLSAARGNSVFKLATRWRAFYAIDSFTSGRSFGTRGANGKSSMVKLGREQVKYELIELVFGGGCYNISGVRAATAPDLLCWV